jgi:hypothetical protein
LSLTNHPAEPRGVFKPPPEKTVFRDMRLAVTYYPFLSHEIKGSDQTINIQPAGWRLMIGTISN